MDQTYAISQSDLMVRLGTAQAPLLLDVCLPDDVAADPVRLPGARRVSHRDRDAIRSATSHGTPTVVVCQKGLKLSHGVAAQLRAQGLKAHALTGGVLGWGASGLPRMAESAAAHTYVLEPGSARLAALIVWAIRRWLAPEAELLWVPKDMGAAVAERFDGQAVNHTNPSALIAQAGCEWAPLHGFLNGALSGADQWVLMLDALPRLHSTAEAASAAALPVIDAAWSALRKDMA